MWAVEHLAAACGTAAQRTAHPGHEGDQSDSGLCHDRAVTAPTYPSTVGRILERTARRLPDKLALTFADRHWTYAELDRAVSRVAAGLRAQGLSPGDRVIAFGKNSDAYLLSYLGCARAGLVHVPVNFNSKGEELAYLLTQS